MPDLILNARLQHLVVTAYESFDVLLVLLLQG